MRIYKFQHFHLFLWALQNLHLFVCFRPVIPIFIFLFLFYLLCMHLQSNLSSKNFRDYEKFVRKGPSTIFS